jgi:hypothetical protein
VQVEALTRSTRCECMGCVCHFHRASVSAKRGTLGWIVCSPSATTAKWYGAPPSQYHLPRV